MSACLLDVMRGEDNEMVNIFYCQMSNTEAYNKFQAEKQSVDEKLTQRKAYRPNNPF